MSKDTLCWYCKNACGNCSWSNGTFTPVNGWVVDTSKKIRGLDEESYTVVKCPNYKEFYRQLSTDDVAKIIGVSPRTIGRLKTYSIKSLCKKAGKNLYISTNNKQRNFYLVNEDNEHSL